jgi:TetR/AcrR family transcriptional repressor of nem operon
VTVAPDTNEKPTAERILDIAERLVQTRGFTNFSYADIAAELGITKASLHYHFPGKAELGQAVIARYGERFAEALREIDRTVPDARAKLEAYAGLYADVLRGNRMCMCGVLAGEYETLPDPMQAAVVRFFDDNQTWLVHVLDEGLQDRTLAFSGSKEDVAQTILVTLEGAMLVARPYGDLGRFTATSQQLLLGLAGSRAV